jgi:hypothetical protein
MRIVARRIALLLVVAMSLGCFSCFRRTDTKDADAVVVGNQDELPQYTPQSEHLTLGNPSNAAADTNQPDNYLML